MNKEEFKQFSGKTGGILWEKHGFTRIYLNRGDNTKRVITSCYLFLMDNGDIGLKIDIKSTRPWRDMISFENGYAAPARAQLRNDIIQEMSELSINIK